MKKLIPSFSIHSSLLFGFFVALSLHIVFFSYASMRRRYQAETAPIVKIKDNTPALLEFSSLSSSADHLENLAFPKATLLPPPVAVLPSLEGPRSGKSPAPLYRSRQRSRVSVKPSRQKRSLSLRGSKEVGEEALSTSLEDLRSLPSLFGPNAQEWSAALENLHRLRKKGQSAEIRSEISETITPISLAKDNSLSLLKRVDSTEHDRYLALWNQARPVALQGTEQTFLQKLTVQVRQTSLKNVRAQDVNLRHGQVIALRDGLLLLWINGDHIYLVFAPQMAMNNTN
jgi:hypothetical protein